ncbi:chromate transporter [Escherichia coli]|uniref:chromate transporter n=1 Tax=Escherichia coli TaxID=562 RepID=UPI003D9C8401
MVDSFYRVGSLVFGGGHVVLPLLQAEVVPSGWVNNESFLAGYGAAQRCRPFVHVRRVSWCLDEHRPVGWIGGIVCLLAIFAPSFLLVVGSMPFGSVLRRNTGIQAALARDQCRCSRLAAGRAVSACMD